jgi:hypothetical protein
MNHEDRVIRVEHVYYLQEPATTSLALDQELVFAYLLRERRLSVSDNEFSFLRFDPMFANMVLIPISTETAWFFPAAIIARKALSPP